MIARRGPHGASLERRRDSIERFDRLRYRMILAAGGIATAVLAMLVGMALLPIL